MRVSEIRVNQIRVNQGLGVLISCTANRFTVLQFIALPLHTYLGPCIAESKGLFLLSNTLVELYFKKQNYFDNPLRLHKTVFLT